MEEHIYRELYELEESHWWFRGRRSIIWALLARAGCVANPRVLDAGCGTGRNLVEYGPLGTAAGVDASATAVAFCHERRLDGVVESSVEQMPFADGSFDLILATDVLEHIARDDLAARELRRVAGADARLVVVGPAYQWLWSQHDESHHHMRRYTASRLHALLAAAGWEPVVETYFNTVLLAPIAAVRLLMRRRAVDGIRSDYRLTGRLNDALAQVMRAEASLIRRGVRLPAGVSVGMVCRPAAPVGA